MITLEALLVLSYLEDQGQRRSLSVRWGLLKDLALGHISPQELENVTRRALLQNHYLEETDGDYKLTSRLAWQTGVACG